MEIATYVAICTNVYVSSVVWTRVFTGQPEAALKKAKEYVSKDWGKIVKRFNINPDDYDDCNVHDVEPHGDKYVAYVYDGNDVIYSWEIVRAETEYIHVETDKSPADDIEETLERMRSYPNKLRALLGSVCKPCE